MGMLVYNGVTELAMDDRTLAHLQVIFIDKLRRRESFTFEWDQGRDRFVGWMGPSIPLEFVYSGNRQPALNRVWLEQLAHVASAGNLVVTPEPPMPTIPASAPRPVAVSG